MLTAASHSTAHLHSAVLASVEAVSATLLSLEEENEQLRSELRIAEGTVVALQDDLEGYWAMEKKLDQEQKSAAAMRLALEHSVLTRMSPQKGGATDQGENVPGIGHEYESDIEEVKISMGNQWHATKV